MAYDASKIKVLDGLEHVRTRPAMYIGSTNVRGLNHLVYEIVDNAVDEFAQGYGNVIEVTLSREGECLVSDHGRGIPVDVHPQTGVSALRTVLTTLNAGGKFDSSSYKYSSGLHGVGSSVVNALSEYFSVSVVKDGKAYIDTYRKGVPATKLNSDGSLPFVETGRTGSGTSICFKPDPEVFSTVEFKASDIKERLHETAYLNPNLTIKFIDERVDPVEKVTYHEPNGIVQYLKDLNSSESSVCDPHEFSSIFEGDEGPIEVSVAFQWVESLQERITGFCNNIQTVEGGTHVTALKSTLTALVNQYARQVGVLKEKDSNFTGPDVRSGFSAVVSVKHPNPQFEGQTKTKLDNADAYKAVSSVCSQEFQLYFDRNVDVLKKVLAIAEKSAKVRKAEAKTRQNLFSQKRKYSFDSNGKLAGCESKDSSQTELYVVEGDSAAGSSKMARDRRYQAILPIRGKILNVEKAPVEKILANSEIKTLIYALGCGFSEGYGQDFDISKLKYNKVICMCFTGDTMIKSCDGSSYSFEDLVSRGVKSLWVYSRNKSGDVTASLAVNPRVTGTTTKLAEVTLSNGRTVKCTPDHLFMLPDGTYCEAQSLSVGDELFSLYQDSSRACPSPVNSVRKSLEVVALMTANDVEVNRKSYQKHAEKVDGRRPASYDDVIRQFGSVENAVERSQRLNLTVESIRLVDVDETPVYCITVDDNANFCLDDGVFVHNCDSDVDGSHIVTLLLTIFYRLLPDLVHQGHVYVACPPLYKVTPKRGSEKYLYNDKDLEEYRKSHSGFRLQRYKGLGEMNPQQLWETTMNPETRLLKRVRVTNDSEANRVTSNLMGSNVEPRRRFIFERAQEANLDV